MWNKMRKMNVKMNVIGKRSLLALPAGLGLLLAGGAPAMAQTTPAPTLNSGDTAWMLISSVIVLMMTIPGLALYYGGLLRRKNILAMLMQCFFATALISVLWCIVGYSLA